VESECGFSLRSAQNYMRVARLADKNATVAHLPLATLYRMTGRRSSRWMLIAAAERAEEGEEMTEAELERLYKTFINPKARRSRRKSRDLAQNGDTGKSGRNPRAEFAERSPRAAFAGKNSTVERGLSRAEYIEVGADWIVEKLGRGAAAILLLLHRNDTLSDTLCRVSEKLDRPGLMRKIDPPLHWS
jgi:hypothetical protein